MKLFSIFIISGCVLDSFAITLDCRKICHDYSRRQDFLSARSCNGALNFQPRDVHKACVKGKLLAFEQSCVPTCLDEKWRGKTETGNSFQACQDFAKKPSPNHHLSWCRKGFDDYYRKITSDIKDKVKEVIAEQIKAMDEEATSSNYQEQEVEHFNAEDQEIVPIQRQNESKENDSKAASLNDEQNELEENRVMLEVEKDDKMSILEEEADPKEIISTQNSNHNTSELEEPSERQSDIEALMDEAIGIISQESKNTTEPIGDSPVVDIEMSIFLKGVQPDELENDVTIDTSVETRTDNYTMAIDSQTDSIFLQKSTGEFYGEDPSFTANEF